jgi:hypothetical protein
MGPPRPVTGFPSPFTFNFCLNFLQDLLHCGINKGIICSSRKLRHNWENRHLSSEEFDVQTIVNLLQQGGKGLCLILKRYTLKYLLISSEEVRYIAIFLYDQKQNMRVKICAANVPITGSL